MTEMDLASLDFSTNVRFEDLKGMAFRGYMKSFGAAINTMALFDAKAAGNAALKRFFHNTQKTFRPRGVFSTVSPEFVQIGRREIAVYRFGSGPKVLLCHGWAGEASDFYRIVPELVRAGFEVITFDGPAHGQSSGSHSHMFEFSQVIAEIARRENDIAVAIGHSMGGAAVAFANHISAEFQPEKIITVGAPNKLKTVFEEFSKACGFTEKATEAVLEKVETMSDFSFEDLTLERLLDEKTGGFQTMLVHDRLDNVIPFERFQEIKETAKVGRSVETVGLGHVRVLRDEKVIGSLLSFIAS